MFCLLLKAGHKVGYVRLMPKRAWGLMTGQLAEPSCVRDRLCRKWMDRGVTIGDPPQPGLSDCTIGEDTVIYLTRTSSRVLRSAVTAL